MHWLVHVGLAVVLFLLVNWIGKHSIEFGYRSTTLFEEPNESVALNFFLRALAPTVFIIALSAVVVSVGFPTLRDNVYRIVIYYYGLRALVIFILNRQHLVSWSRYLLHAGAGIAVSLIAYRHLIVPNRSLIPDLNQAGNELWLAIFAFLYAVANKIPLPEGPGARRRNAFIRAHYIKALDRFGRLLEKKLPEDLLRLTALSIMIYEDFCRPPAIRVIERFMVFKKNRTTGVMQVKSSTSLSDFESVRLGTDILIASWNAPDDVTEGDYVFYYKVRRVISEYNQDEDYIQRVMEVMEIIAVRIDPSYKAAYAKMGSS